MKIPHKWLPVKHCGAHNSIPKPCKLTEEMKLKKQKCPDKRTPEKYYYQPKDFQWIGIA